MFLRYPVAILILFQSFNSLGQGGQNYFRLTLINNSGGAAISSIQGYEKADTVIAGQKRIIVYELDDEQLSFYLNLETIDSSTGMHQYKMIRILNTQRSKEIIITAKGKPEYVLTTEERTVAVYNPGLRRKNFWKLDSVIHANSNNLAAPEIIYLSICDIDVPTDTILRYYNRLSPEIRASGFGKRIVRYLENRSRLNIGKIFDNFELPDTTGKIVQLKDIKSDYILLDFWFSRCGPCIASFPEVEKLYWATKRSKLAIMSISADSKADHALWLISILKYYMAWINLNDPNYKLVSSLAIGNYPTRILLDKDRKIVLLDTDNSQDDFFEKVKKLANK